MNILTATGYVLNEDKTRILLVLHKKLGRWLPPGGHIDGDEPPHEAVIREVAEETGLAARIVDLSPDLACDDPHTQQIPAPYLMHRDEIPPYDQVEKHFYIDLVFILQASGGSLAPQLDEVDEVRWFTKSELATCDTWEIVKKIAYQIMR